MISKSKQAQIRRLQNEVELLKLDKAHYVESYNNLYYMLQKIWDAPTTIEAAQGIVDAISTATIIDEAMWHLYPERRQKVKRSQRKPRKATVGGDR